MSAAASSSSSSSLPLALLEVLDRDGHVRHQMKVLQWPVRVGRALDNDWVLDDPHTAGRHFTLSADESGRDVQLEVGDSINGLWVEQTHLPGRSVAVLGRPVVSIKAGETIFRLRTAAQALAPERPIEASPRPLRGTPVLWATGALWLATLALRTWLYSDPLEWLFTTGVTLVMALGVLLGWCGLWGLLSKLVTRRANLGWHARVALLASLVWGITDLVPGLLAFAFSRPEIASFGFVLTMLILALAVVFHMRQVEPNRRWRRRGVAVLVLIVGLSANVCSNLYVNDRFGQGLYLTQLYPPSVRLAPANDLDHFMQGVAQVQDALEEDIAADGDDGNDEAE